MTTNKLTRRQFLATLATAAVGALIGGVVQVEEPALEADVQAVPLGRYLLEDNFDNAGSVDGTLATPGPGVRHVIGGEWACIDNGVIVFRGRLVYALGEVPIEHDVS